MQGGGGTKTAAVTPVSTSTPVQKTDVSPGTKVVTGNNHFGCTSKESYQKLLGFVVDHDKAAFEQGLSAGISTGLCTVFHSGEAVSLSDTAVFSGIVKLRRKGETVEYWTTMEAVR